MKNEKRPVPPEKAVFKLVNDVAVTHSILWEAEESLESGVWNYAQRARAIKAKSRFLECVNALARSVEARRDFNNFIKHLSNSSPERASILVGDVRYALVMNRRNGQSGN